MPDRAEADAEITGGDTAAVQSTADLARLLRRLRRRDARQRNDSQLSYRELAAKTGWSPSAVGLYLSGQALPPTDRFDVLIQLLGASRVEQGLLATARDRMEERRYAPSDGVAARPAPLAPHTLPAPTPHFTGRQTELLALAGLLAAHGDRGGTVVISAIGGTAGVGKTALAVYWAHRIVDRFPDGQLYVNLRGFDPGAQSMDPAEAVRYFLEALQVAPQRIPATLDGQTALYRSLLSGKRMLIVLDNARDTGQVRPLLPGTPGCLVLVTSRNQLSGLVATDGAQPITLDLLTEDEAHEFLAQRLGRERVAAELGTIKEIIWYCARLPLALAIVAARAATNPHIALTALAAELRDTRRRWTTLSGDDPTTDVRAVFSWSYRDLTPAAARLFRLLGLHPGPDFSAAAAASIAGVPPGEAELSLADLARAHLIVEQAAGRYVLHDLLRAYAAGLADADAEPERLAATRRMLDHYLHSGFAAERLLNEHGDPVALDPLAPGVTPEYPADSGQALAWFSAEHAVLFAAISQPVPGFESLTSRLAWVFAVYLDRRGHWHDWIVIAQLTLAVAERTGDRAAQALAHRHLGRANTHLNRLDQARTHLQHALDLTSPQGDAVTQAHVHLLLSDIAARRGDHAGALDHAQHALDRYVSADHRRGQADALNTVGWWHAMLGNYRETIAYCEQAIALHRELGPGIVEATTWDSLAYAHHHLGDYDHAVTCYRRAVELFEELGDRYYHAETLTRLGETHQAAGRPEAAQEVWRRALAILEELGHADAEAVRVKLGSHP
ncbi:helix-turn-helix domain-containing protein [Allorhizocola rhizosphaerae]|uniref:helix-turn-helix domain-containing protein n=1 Tax=Allorhizocola rhizosphaerae TaxID=1872709 RepID=UPI000E3E4988|nr:helix-turn-helix domain-containing protein [Allorhizocola rhizosphaerae]